MFKILGHDGREYGPISAEMLCRWIAENRVNGDTQVMPEGSKQWQPLRDVPGFGGSLAVPAPMVATPTTDSGINKIIPYRNVPALVGYYCAVFAVIPGVGAVLGPVAFVLGIVGLRVRRQNPAAGGKVHAWIGIILGGLLSLAYLALIVFAIFGANRR